MVKISLLRLNELNLHLIDKYDFNFINENNLKKRLNDNNYNDFDILTMLFIDKYFMENNYYDNKLWWLLKNDIDKKIIDLEKTFNENDLKNLRLSVNNDSWLKKWYNDIL